MKRFPCYGINRWRRQPALRPKQVKNKKFYENFDAPYLYFKKKCDICTYKSGKVGFVKRKIVEK